MRFRAWRKPAMFIAPRQIVAPRLRSPRQTVALRCDRKWFWTGLLANRERSDQHYVDGARIAVNHAACRPDTLHESATSRSPTALENIAAIAVGDNDWPNDATAQSPARPNCPFMSGSSRFTGPRVLVVEDHAETADFLSRYARLLACDVRTASSGEQALDTALDFSPQIVLLDIDLPDMDGWELARRLRDRRDPMQPVLIALTGFHSPEDRIRSLEAGIDYHLNKPEFREELMRLLLHLVGRCEA